MHCIHCGSDNVVFRKKYPTKTGFSVQHNCKDCGKYFSLPENYNNDFEVRAQGQCYVVTAAQNNTPINTEFFETLKTYCKINNAELLVIPVKYNNPNVFISEDDVTWDAELDEYLTTTNVRIHDRLTVMGSLRINATADNPLAGLDSLSKGNSLIIGHQQLQLKTLPVQSDDIPVILTTTGVVTEKNYSISKQGAKADFNHSFSAVVVDIPEGLDEFHIRHLNFDGAGFHDLEYAYTVAGRNKSAVEALVTGDEHVIFIDPEVYDATYGIGGLVDTLKPSYIVRHDVIDCYSVSHHHYNNVFTRFAKHNTGVNDLERELNEVVDFIINTTPANTKNFIVSSNHHDHITRWLNECDPKIDLQNARLYHKLMYEMLTQTYFDPEQGGTVHPNPFELYAAPIFAKVGTTVEFLGRSETHKILDVEIASHGDVGNNGSRGSRLQFANLPSKTIIGHSHSPGINKGCYQVGTSSRLKLEYNRGASSWLNSHCIIHKNGKRQLINIINGRYR